LLFDDASLPETEPVRVRRRHRRSVAAAAEGVGADTIREAPPSPVFPVAMPRAIPPETPSRSAPFDPAGLTNPELRALARALPDRRLVCLLEEIVREIRRRLTETDDEEAEMSAPNPVLLRAARQAAGELTGEDD